MSFIHCKHYAGREMFLGDCVCKAGINPVETFCDGSRLGWVRKVPCLRTNENVPHCEHATYPTMEEEKKRQAKLEAKMDDFIETVVVVRPRIEALHKETGDWSGFVECPKCSNKMDWSKSQYNGHIHAKCRTEGCISWME